MELELNVEPSSYTLKSEIDIKTNPKHKYVINSISTPQFSIKGMRRTKSGFGYGLELAHYSSAKYISFEYDFPNQALDGVNGYGWQTNEFSNFYRIRQVGVNVVLDKQFGNLFFGVNAGVFNDYNFARRQDPTVRFEYFGVQRILLSSTSSPAYVIGVEGHEITQPNTSLSYLIISLNTSLKLKDNIRIGGVLRWRQFPIQYVWFRNFEQREFIELPLEAIILDNSNKVGEVLVKQDKLNLGFSIAYTLSHQLKQKRKQRKKKQKLEKGA